MKGPANVQRGAIAQGPAFYCPGWLRQLLSPTPQVWHNGGTIGSKAVVAFTPDGDLGLVVLSNLDGTDLPEALMYHLYDLCHARPAKDHAAEFLADAKARARGRHVSRPAGDARSGTGTDGLRWNLPQPVLRAARGGRGGRLLLTVGPRKTPVRLKHCDGDTFAISLPGYGAPKYTDGFVTFVFGEAGQALELRLIRGFDDADDGRFTRAAGR